MIIRKTAAALLCLALLLSLASFRPGNEINRSEATAILSRFIDKL